MINSRKGEDIHFGVPWTECIVIYILKFMRIWFQDRNFIIIIIQNTINT